MISQLRKVSDMSTYHSSKLTNNPKTIMEKAIITKIFGRILYPPFYVHIRGTGWIKHMHETVFSKLGPGVVKMRQNH